MSQYVKLITATTPYANRMAYLSNRIFGDILTKEDRRSARIVRLFEEKPVYKRNFIVNYYPRLKETFHLMTKLRKLGLYNDEHYEFKMQMKQSRLLRGKVKPKKGCGKQAVNK